MIYIEVVLIKLFSNFFNKLIENFKISNLL